MSVIAIQPFGGLVPKVTPDMLPDNGAQVAAHVRLTSGGLEAFKDAQQVHDPLRANIQTIYRFGRNTISDTDYWLVWTDVVDVVKGAIANDTEERTYFTGDGYPKATNAALALAGAPFPSAAYRLGAPAPTNPAVVNVTAAPVPDPTAIAETRVYIYTFVTDWGEESAPSAASNEVDVRTGDTVRLIGMATSPGGNFNVTRKRIYRTAVGATGTDYLFVDEIPAAQTDYTDSKTGDQLAEAVPSIDWDILPADARGMTAMANGIMAAHTEYDVFLSPPYKPYTYPPKYSLTVDSPIVGMASFGTSLAVLTTGNPHIISGIDPASASSERLAMPYSCVSKRSIVQYNGGVIYAAPDGLVQISGAGVQVLTDDLMTRREWASYNPSSMLCAVWDDRIFLFYDNGTKGCLILSADQGLTESAVHATAAFADTITGSLYLAVNNKIVKWDAGAAGVYRWKSKRFTVPAPLCFACGQVKADAYPVTMKVYADGVLKHTQAVAGRAPFRLPGGFKASDWEIELSGSNRIIAAYLSTSMEELKNV